MIFKTYSGALIIIVKINAATKIGGIDRKYLINMEKIFFNSGH
jgi:hypothetical protein